jgi:hypothetical protein
MSRFGSRLAGFYLVSALVLSALAGVWLYWCLTVPWAPRADLAADGAAGLFASSPGLFASAATLFFGALAAWCWIRFLRGD